MIDIVDHVTTTLAPLHVNVLFNSVPTGSEIPNQYITFLEITASPAFEAADKEVETTRLIQVNIWSKSNYYPLVESVKQLLEAAGYERTFESDLPKSEGDSHFNKMLRFAFIDDY